MIDDDHPIKSHRAKAWKKGYLAFSLHRNNPYKRPSTQFAWNSGWAAAKREEESGRDPVAPISKTEKPR